MKVNSSGTDNLLMQTSETVLLTLTSYYFSPNNLLTGRTKRLYSENSVFIEASGSAVPLRTYTSRISLQIIRKRLTVMIKKESGQFNISVGGINCEKLIVSTWQN